MDANVQEHLKRGETYFEQNDFDRAISEFAEALRLDPGLAAAKDNVRAAYFNRGGMKFQMGDSKGAIGDFNEAIALDPKDAQGYSARGFIHEKTGKPDEAIADYTEAIRLAPKTVFFYNSRAGCYCDKRNECRAAGDETGYFKYLDLAIQDLKDGLKIVPANAGDTEIQKNMRDWLEQAKRERESRKKAYEGV